MLLNSTNIIFQINIQYIEYICDRCNSSFELFIMPGLYLLLCEAVDLFKEMLEVVRIHTRGDTYVASQLEQ